MRNKELTDLSITHATKKRTFFGVVNNPTWEEVEQLREHMRENYPNPDYVFFNASIWNPDGKERLLRPHSDESKKTLEQFWQELQELLVD